jgi:invasion protein IalB
VLRRLASAFVLLTALCAAGPTLAGTPGPTALVGKWWKICTGATCMVQQFARNSLGAVTGAITVNMQAGKATTVSLRLPDNVGTPVEIDDKAPGSFRIDRAAPRTLPISRCAGPNCYMDFPADTAFLAGLRSGRSLTIEAATMSGGRITADFVLADFATVFDGKDFLTLEQYTLLSAQGRLPR